MYEARKADAGACLFVLYRSKHANLKCISLLFCYSRCIYPFAHVEFFAIFYSVNGGLAQGNPGWRLFGFWT
jgi:hypothetical protein